MTFDNVGSIWIGCYLGLYCYDGSKITEISYKASWCKLGRIMTMVCDRNGDLWIGADNGIKIFKVKDVFFKDIK